MAWTLPRTWVQGETVTHTLMNTHVKDNLNDLDGRMSNKPYVVWPATANQPPASSAATPAIRNNHPVLEFNATTTEESIFSGILSPAYDGGGATVEIYWMADTATASDVVWAAGFERHQVDVTDLDSGGFASDQTTTSTAASAAGELSVATITFTDGAQMDSLAAGESFRLRVRRLGANGSDTMSGDAQLLTVVLRET